MCVCVREDEDEGVAKFEGAEEPTVIPSGADPTSEGEEVWNVECGMAKELKKII